MDLNDRIRAELSWEDVRFFATLARHGSLSAAARALSVNHATVARRISSLEQALGQKLVERRPEGYVLTSAGLDAIAAAQDMEAAAATLGRTHAADDTPKGLVRISATPGIVQGFLAARLSKLSASYPGVDIELASDVRIVSLERREADIALRLARPSDGDVIARPLVTLDYGFYASAHWRQLLEEGHAPVFVGFDEANSYIPDAAWLAQTFPRARRAFRADSQAIQAAAAIAGAGVAMLPHFIGRTHEKLCAVSLGHTPPSRELWMITRQRDNKSRLIRTVTEFLTNLFQQDRALFSSPEKFGPN
jgi:molybdate transport repressor ModE-like protein